MRREVTKRDLILAALVIVGTVACCVGYYRRVTAVPEGRANYAQFADADADTDTGFTTSRRETRRASVGVDFYPAQSEDRSEAEPSEESTGQNRNRQVASEAGAKGNRGKHTDGQARARAQSERSGVNWELPSHNYELIAQRNVFRPANLGEKERKPEGGQVRTVQPAIGGSVGASPIRPTPFLQPSPLQSVPPVPGVGNRPGSFAPPSGMGSMPAPIAEKPKDIAVTGVVTLQGRKMALIENLSTGETYWISEGEAAPFGVRVVRITDSIVQLSRSGITYEYYLGENKRERKVSAPATRPTAPIPPSPPSASSPQGTSSPPKPPSSPPSPSSSNPGSMAPGRQNFYERMLERYGGQIPPEMRERWRRWAGGES